MLGFVGFAGQVPGVPVVGAQPLTAQQPGLQRVAGGIQLNFQDVDLAFVFTALAQAGGLNLIYHDLPAKQVTLRTAQAVPASDIRNLIRSLAVANGVSFQEDGTFIRLVGSGAAGPDPRQLFIYRLQHARATTLAGTLQALFGGTIPQGAARATPVPLSQQLQQLQAAGQQPQVVAGPQGITITTRGGDVSGEVFIVPDEVTNSLLIRASPADWSVVEQALISLDLRPLQVVIEVVIAEVRRGSDRELGVSFEGSRARDDELLEGFLPFRQGSPEDAFSLRLIRFGEVNVQAALRALSTTGDLRILSRPVIMAQNNQPARILVGSQQPFVQLSQILPTDPTGSRNQVVQYRDVGTVLDILPTINEDGYVNLAVTQQVSNATAEVQFGAPVISTREASTQLLARNGQTVVLGGLVDRQQDRTQVGIPFLSRIPLLGRLFSSTRESETTSELFLFLTPYVISSDADADRLREQIEGDSRLLAPFLPVTPLAPPAIPPVIPDTTIIPDTTVIPDTTGVPNRTVIPDTTVIPGSTARPLPTRTGGGGGGGGAAGGGGGAR